MYLRKTEIRKHKKAKLLGLDFPYFLKILLIPILFLVRLFGQNQSFNLI